MGALFEGVRSRVTALEAAQAYGLEFGRNRRARCPWHDDRRPDLAFYDDGARCYCHACHAGGDAVALVAQLYGLDPLEAARKINTDFHLGLDGETYTPPTGPSRAEVRRNLEDWRRKRYGFLCQVESEARTAVESASGWEDPGFTDNLRALAAVQDEIELLHAATTEDLEAIRSNGRGIGAV